jgi:hypothetical protein
MSAAASQVATLTVQRCDEPSAQRSANIERPPRFVRGWVAVAVIARFLRWLSESGYLACGSAQYP